MLLKNSNLEIESEKKTWQLYTSTNLIVQSTGCAISDADALKLFYLLKDNIVIPTVIVLCCNNTDYFATNCKLKIIELQEKYPDYRFIITGCINEIFESKYKRFGKIIYKKDMWNLNNYE